MGTSERSRLIRWEDPLVAARQGLQLSGLEALRAVQRGDISRPPIAELMGIGGGSVEEGMVTLSAEPGEFHYSNTGAAHGGFAATLLDSVMYLAVHSTLPQGVFASTLEIKVNYVRPVSVETGTVLGQGTIVHRGRQLATAEGQLRDAAGKLLAHGSTTCLIRG